MKQDPKPILSRAALEARKIYWCAKYEEPYISRDYAYNKFAEYDIKLKELNESTRTIRPAPRR